ncbi:MAG: hypothetical protein SGPRY_004392, partial [Prymnesium sp.]
MRQLCGKLGSPPSLLLPALLMSLAPPPLSPSELSRAIASLQALAPHGSLPSSRLERLLASSAHLPHKDWAQTEASADELQGILSGPDEPSFRTTFKRVLEDGNWDDAAAAASQRPAASKPWAVLVTGVNGIRKTSSVYQPWFKEVLHSALGPSFTGETHELPGGSDSFFRQLDFMIATVALEEFKELYEVEDVTTYAKMKDRIFTRFRTYAEMLGALLVKESRRKRLNVMVETSGRDIAMFHYIDHFFPDDEYNKLVVHFTINDLEYAERSVDARMLGE